MAQVALGVSGCIAAYKACELLRELQRRDVDVRVVMTAHACRFVTPLTFAALSHHPVYVDPFAATAGDAITHIGWASAADLLLVAPATANILGKMAHGIADDALSTLALAAAVPTIVAPAMNVEMFRHAAVQENLATLRRRGVRVVEPESGYLACGSIGEGRLAAVGQIADVACGVLRGREDLTGLKVVVTAGPTREGIDAVRFLSNPSSGRMGFRLAETARDRGARVWLIAGPTSLCTPWGVERLDVTTAAEMERAVETCFEDCDVLVMAAAVSDHRPVHVAPGKTKKEDLSASIELTTNTDIVARVAARKAHRLVVGFAAETDDLVQHARVKLERKRLDLIVANRVGCEGSGFGSETSSAFLVGKDGKAEEVPLLSKRDLADLIWDRVAMLRGVEGGSAA